AVARGAERDVPLDVLAGREGRALEAPGAALAAPRELDRRRPIVRPAEAEDEARGLCEVDAVVVLRPGEAERLEDRLRRDERERRLPLRRAAAPGRHAADDERALVGRLRRVAVAEEEPAQLVAAPPRLREERHRIAVDLERRRERLDRLVRESRDHAHAAAL